MPVGVGAPGEGRGGKGRLGLDWHTERLSLSHTRALSATSLSPRPVAPLQPQAALAQASSSGPYAGLPKELEGFDTSLGGLDVSENALALHMPKDHVASW